LLPSFLRVLVFEFYGIYFKCDMNPNLQFVKTFMKKESVNASYIINKDEFNHQRQVIQCEKDNW
jgi:hypothetical protein